MFITEVGRKTRSMFKKRDGRPRSSTSSPEPTAALAARLSGGQLGRARDLVGDRRGLRDTFAPFRPVPGSSPANGFGTCCVRRLFVSLSF